MALHQSDNFRYRVGKHQLISCEPFLKTQLDFRSWNIIYDKLHR